MSKGGVVKFHDVHEAPHGAFSMLSAHRVEVRHVQYPSMHHYFLCERFKGSPIEASILSARSMWDVERLVKKAESLNMQREDWDKIKTDVVLVGNYYKFKQNAELQALLISTGGRTLVDHTPTDSFWGDGGDGSGKNILGVILMAVRKRLMTEDRQSTKLKGKR